jgi:hypothetical protein
MKGSDGRAALRCWPIEVRLAGRSYRIPGRPAVDWIVKVADENWMAIVPGMIDGYEIDDLIDDGKVSHQVLISTGRDAVETATGMPWWSACRLVKATVHDVELIGALLLAGADVERISIGAYVAMTYRLMVADRSKKQRASLDADLGRVPRGVRTEELYDPQKASAQFEQAFARQRTER